MTHDEVVSFTKGFLLGAGIVWALFTLVWMFPKA